jgi:N-acetylglucosaminyldiphosphoundecaprenol N-acetyl-beta-D-mannosaminyltransferase
MSNELHTSGDWRCRWLTLASRVCRVKSDVEQDGLLTVLCQSDKPVSIAFINAHAMNMAVRSEAFFKSLEQADYLFRDGSGMAAFFRLLNMDAGANLNGTDLIPKLIKRFNGRKIAFLGTADPHLQKGVEAAKEQLAKRSMFYSAHGFHDAGFYLDFARREVPQLIVLGMGMPKQEDIANVLRLNLHHPCLIVCGGAIIDFLGGRVARAPRWMRIVGMEWLYRLAVEPRRLFHRYVIGNPVFLMRAMQAARLHRSSRVI